MVGKGRCRPCGLELKLHGGVLPHAWLADLVANYMLACRWLPSAAGSLVSRRRFALACAGAVASLLLVTKSLLECLIRERLCVCVPLAIQFVCRRENPFDFDPSLVAFGQASWRLVCAFAEALDALVALMWEWPLYSTGLSALLVMAART